MIFIEKILIYTGEDHLKSGLPPVKVLDFAHCGHDENKLIESATTNAKQNMDKYGLMKGAATFVVNRTSDIIIYNDKE